MSKGCVSFVLHAHLPYVYHPEYDSFLEERWFFEAMTETYIPLIKFLNGLVKDQVPFKITLSISPSLLAMMENSCLQERYHAHLNKLIELGEKELDRTRHEPHFHWLAGIYRDILIENREVFVTQCQRRVSQTFLKFYDVGVLDLITTSATHGLLPLLAVQPKAVQAQIKIGLNYFKDIFGFNPKGMWLPECGFYKGIDELLADEGIRYFILESHGLENADVNTGHGVYQPIYTPHGVAVFGRDQGVTKQVWSAESGFPGHPDYREFYRDIGHELDFNYIQPYIEGQTRVDTGFKYYRITDRRSSIKQPYHPDVAQERAAQHAEEFIRQRINHINALSSNMNMTPIVVAPFDAELFGHWWFEGPQWLNFVIRKAAYDQDSYFLMSPSDFLDQHPVQKVANPAPSTWGHNGYFENWMNPKVDWIYPQLYECCERMTQLVQCQHKSKMTHKVKRALNQCARELLLAQCSDWAFIINNNTCAEYAIRRFKDHVARFHFLADAVEHNSVDHQKLALIEAMDDIFPNVDYKVFL